MAVTDRRTVNTLNLIHDLQERWNELASQYARRHAEAAKLEIYAAVAASPEGRAILDQLRSVPPPPTQPDDLAVKHLLGALGVVRKNGREPTLREAAEACAEAMAADLLAADPFLTREMAIAKAWRSPFGSTLQHFTRLPCSDAPVSDAMRTIARFYPDFVEAVAKTIPKAESPAERELRGAVNRLMAADPSLTVEQARYQIRKRRPDLVRLVEDERGAS